MTTFQRIVKYCATALAIFLIVSIIGGICGAVGIFFHLFDDRAAGQLQTFEVSGEVESLDLEISAAELKIVSGDQFSVESNHKYLMVEEKDGTLKIYEKKVLLGASSEGVTVVLTVPEGFVFEDASLETGAGKTDIASLSANTLELELGAGATEIGNLTVLTRASISTGAGKLTVLDGQLGNLTMDIGVGKLELTARVTGQCQVNFGIGDADLTLLGSREDYQIKLDKGIGSATLDGTAMESGSVYGGGENRIDISGGIGSIHIRFREG